MSRICAITGKRSLSGNKVSHSNRKTKRVFNINLQKKRLWSEKEKKFIKIQVTAKALRSINKNGLDFYIVKLRRENGS